MRRPPGCRCSYEERPPEEERPSSETAETPIVREARTVQQAQSRTLVTRPAEPVAGVRLTTPWYRRGHNLGTFWAHEGEKRCGPSTIVDRCGSGIIPSHEQSGGFRQATANSEKRPGRAFKAATQVRIPLGVPAEAFCQYRLRARPRPALCVLPGLPGLVGGPLPTGRTPGAPDRAASSVRRPSAPAL